VKVQFEGRAEADGTAADDENGKELINGHVGSLRRITVFTDPAVPTRCGCQTVSINGTMKA
jgi:hypothetical protein